jgi:membrane associated rhomboid family serine protease
MAFLPIYDDTPRRHLAVATYALILACIAVFLWQVSLGPRGEHNADLAYGMVPAVLFGEAELPARSAPMSCSIRAAMSRSSSGS